MENGFGRIEIKVTCWINDRPFSVEILLKLIGGVEVVHYSPTLAKSWATEA